MSSCTESRKFAKVLGGCLWKVMFWSFKEFIRPRVNSNVGGVTVIFITKVQGKVRATPTFRIGFEFDIKINVFLEDLGSCDFEP
jgi:hypothetical protein